MPTDTFKSLIDRVAKIEKACGPTGRDKIAKKVGELAVKDAEQVVASSPLGGDRAFSHWTRKSPIKVAVTAKVLVGQGAVKLSPGKSAGPWTVANSGRKSYGAGERRVSGSYKSKKTGQTKQRTRKVKRNVGGHGGWGVQDAVVAKWDALTPKRVDAEWSKAIKDAFG